MNEISHTVRRPTLSSSTRVNTPPKQADVEDFDRSLRQLEKPQDNIAVNEFVQRQSFQRPGSDNVITNEAVEEGGKTDLAADRTDARDSSLTRDERNTSQDSHSFEAVLDTAIPQWSPPSGIESTELMVNESAMMTLNDFTSLLEQGWHPRSTTGEQVWRFTLQDTGLPLTRIVLKGDSVANGQWSVALTAQDADKLALSQHLQQLRTRLEKLDHNISHVVFAEDDPQ